MGDACSKVSFADVALVKTLTKSTAATCFMSEEPGAYWDKDIGWCFKTPLRPSSANS
jgi:hypothetical protein